MYGNPNTNIYKSHLYIWESIAIIAADFHKNGVQTMLRKLAFFVALAMAFVSFQSFAVVPDGDSAVSTNFKKIGRDMRSLGKISDAAELSALMTKFYDAVSANLNEVPSFMEEGSQAHIDYKQGIEDFLAKIEEAKALADAGDLDGAKAITGTFRNIKTESHEYFELED